MLPGGPIELQFLTENDLTAAAKLLKEYSVSANESALSLTVTTDGSVSGLTRLLGTLERAKIEIAEFAQKAPSLDDVFLKVISDKEKK